MKAAKAPWAAQISGDDPRFRLLQGIVHGVSLREHIRRLSKNAAVTGRAYEMAQLVARLPDVKARVRDIEQLNLEDALEDWLAHIIPEDTRRNSIARRLGWTGSPPETLAAIGKELGLTRERVRQVQAQTLERLPGAHPLFLPVLDNAIEAVTMSTPMADEAATAFTVEHGYSRSGFHPAALVATANALGHEHVLQCVSIKGAHFVTTTDAELHIRALSRIARKLAGASGAFSVSHAQHQCAKRDIDLDEQRIRRLLESIPDFVPLDRDRDWWRATGLPDGRDRLVNITMKMLSVVSPLHVKSVREGLTRVYRWRASSNRHLRDVLAVPPLVILQRLFEHHEAFSVVGDMVSCRMPLDYRNLLGVSERILVEILRSSATGTLDRATLAKRAMGRGIGESSFDANTSYSPLLERAGRGALRIRGTAIRPSRGS